MVCLDSDILISFLQGDEAAVAKVEQLRQGGAGPLRTTVVNAYELTKGVMLSKTKEENGLQVRRLISQMEVLELDQESSEAGAGIFSELKDRGAMANELDVLIAGIVVRHKEKLVSRDKDFKRMPAIDLDEW